MKPLFENMGRLFGKAAVLGIVFTLFYQTAGAQAQVPIPYFDLTVREASNPNEVSLSLQILFLLTILTIAPSILIMMTSFVRVAIILKFIQRALSLQQEPPNQVIMGLALFITLFIMMSTMEKIYEDAYLPYSKQTISNEEFFERSLKPLREFMLRQVRDKDVDLFLFLGKKERPATPEDVSTIVLIPAFLISELTIAFKIGIYLFIPFVVIDMIVASVLMSMGMIMLPPVMVSLPFKLILFVLVDGWHLITLQTVKSFNLF